MLLHHGPPTWRRLVEAVDNPAGGSNHSLAERIAIDKPIGKSFIALYTHAQHSKLK